MPPMFNKRSKGFLVPRKPLHVVEISVHFTDTAVNVVRVGQGPSQAGSRL